MNSRCGIAPIIGIAVALGLGSASALATEFISFDFPSSVATYGMGISGNNIVGYYIDTAQQNHGFEYDGSNFTSIDNPLAASGYDLGTVANAISGNRIVGYYKDSGGVPHGFIKDGPTFTTLDDPLGAKGTVAQGTDGANVVGYYIDASGAPHSFLFDGSSYSTISIPSGFADVFDVSGNSFVGGYYPNSGFPVDAFLYDGSTYTTVHYPGGAIGSVATGLSQNYIVGYYEEQLIENYFGYIYDGVNYHDVFFPTSTGHYQPTFVYGVDGDSLVGWYQSSTGNHGFVANGLQDIPEPFIGIGTIGTAPLIVSFGPAGQRRTVPGL